VLPYSNWETGTVCYSESFESLSEGFQNALWELGGVPKEHQTDRLSAAVCKTRSPEEFTQRYSALLRHYGVKGRKIQTGKPNENGDVEQLHYRFKKAVEQSLLLRGSHDFETREAYEQFLRTLFKQLDAGRQKRFEEGVNHNVYSVDSRLIGEYINVRLYAVHLEVWYGQRCIEKIPRLRGEGNHRIQYRHIIDWLVRKPGAFEHYRYREDLFPTHRFRIAYDTLKRRSPSRAAKQYVKILHFAARENEAAVDGALRLLIEEEQAISYEAVKERVQSGSPQDDAFQDVVIDPVDVRVYDELLSGKVVV
jgi:hypothetical protein